MGGRRGNRRPRRAGMWTARTAPSHLRHLRRHRADSAARNQPGHQRDADRVATGPQAVDRHATDGDGYGPAARAVVGSDPSRTTGSEPSTKLDVGWLTPERITLALRAGGSIPPDVAVVDVTATPVGTGQMASCVRLALCFDGETTTPTSIVAKIPATDDASRRAGSAGAYETEVRFYQQLASKVSIRVPRCYHAEVGPEPGA